MSAGPCDSSHLFLGPLRTSSHSPGLTLLAPPTISSCHPLTIPPASKNSNVPFYHCLQSRAVVCQKDLALPSPLALDHYPKFNPTGAPPVSKKTGGKACEELLHTLCLLGKPHGCQKRVLMIGKTAQLVKCLPCKYKDLCPTPGPTF